MARLGVVAALMLAGLSLARPARAQAAGELTWTETISAPPDGVINPGDTFDDTITVINGATDATTVDVIDLFVGPLTFVDSVSGAPSSRLVRASWSVPRSRCCRPAPRRRSRSG
jgi:hypothetical protein